MRSLQRFTSHSPNAATAPLPIGDMDVSRLLVVTALAAVVEGGEARVSKERFADSVDGWRKAKITQKVHSNESAKGRVSVHQSLQDELRMPALKLTF